jgi:hypothetical protein
MKNSRLLTCLGPICLLLAGCFAASAQQSFTQRVTSHNASMTALQPAMVTPLVAPDPRLVQYAKLSFAHQYTPTGTETISFGNNRGIGLIGGNRFEFDFVPPSYVQRNSKAMDGFGDFSTLVKYRIASGNAQHGNYVVTAILNRCFATGSYKNGALTDSYGPALAGGKTFGKLDVITSLGGNLPTGKIATQGRSIAWHSVVQAHVSRPLWLELENNSAFYFAGKNDGKVQNFVTPAAIYVYRKREWKPQHPFLIFAGGMQIATSHFHAYNHNLIGEMRILF